jgi:hypothetical protein
MCVIAGIVTRRPLVLQLIHRVATGKDSTPTSPKTNGDAAASSSTDAASNPDEWGEFLHRPGEKFYDFSKIRDEIVRDTEMKTGKNAGESLEVVSNRVLVWLFDPPSFLSSRNLSRADKLAHLLPQCPYSHSR